MSDTRRMKASSEGTYPDTGAVLGRYVRQLRESRQMSVYRLAKSLAVDHSTILRIECGERNVSRPMVERLGWILPTHPEQRTRLYHMAGFLTPEEWKECTNE